MRKGRGAFRGGAWEIKVPGEREGVGLCPASEEGGCGEGGGAGCRAPGGPMPCSLLRDLRDLAACPAPAETDRTSGGHVGVQRE